MSDDNVATLRSMFSLISINVGGIFEVDTFNDGLLKWDQSFAEEIIEVLLGKRYHVGVRP